MPDYSKAMLWTYQRSFTEQNYLVPEDGWVFASISCGSANTEFSKNGYIKVNGNVILNPRNSGGSGSVAVVDYTIPVKKGDILTLYSVYGEDTNWRYNGKDVLNSICFVQSYK